jgi:predicted dithiol-disulfide oxidoreductase (DUF899 family)
MKTDHATEHPVVSREQWRAARMALLAREKQLTRLQDEIARERRALPWVRVDKDYVFDTPKAPARSANSSTAAASCWCSTSCSRRAGNRGCKSCSFMADHNDGANLHLAQRDVTLLAISRAPLADIERFRQRMGWKFRWVSSTGTDFKPRFRRQLHAGEMASGQVDYNYQRQRFPHEEAPGISVFFRNAGREVFHTYSRFGRGVEVMMHTYPLLELTPKGRDEDALDTRWRGCATTIATRRERARDDAPKCYA